MESAFQSEKWNLVAKAMSRTGLPTCSAEAIQARYETLTMKSKKADAEDGNKSDISSNLQRQTTRAIGVDFPGISASSRTDVEKVDEASTAMDVPAKGAERGRRVVSQGKTQHQIAHSDRMRKVWAIRRAKGTDGHRGGPPKAATIAKTARSGGPNTTPNTGASLAPAVPLQSSHTQDSLPKQTQPTFLHQDLSRDVNPHQKSLAQIVPATPQANGGPRRKTSYWNVSMHRKLR